MSKSEHFLRYGAIINKLRNNRESTFEEIYSHLQQESDIRGYNLTVSKRTFQRDLDEIRSMFNVVIQFDFSRKVYHIVEDSEQTDLNNYMLEAFEMFNTLNVAGNLSRYIHFANRKPKGMEHFYGLLHAIKNRFTIRFTYLKYWEDEPSSRLVEPYFMKEFKGIWYVLVKDLKDNKIKTFGIDRISDLEITKKRFAIANELNVNEIFRHSFGIYCPENSKPQEVVLSFEPVQGRYVKSYPLHQSQQVIEDTEDGIRIKLFVYITYDFIKELLSYGDTMKVISPKALISEVRKEYSQAMKQYE